MGVFIGQLHHVFTIVAERFTALGLNDNGAIGSVWLLKTRVAVEPIGACLLDRKFIGECFTRLDTWKTDTWHTILVEGKDQSVPVDRGHLVQVVGHVDFDVFTFLEAHHRSRRCTIVADTFFHEIAGINFNPVNRQAVFTGHDHGRHQQGQKPCQKAYLHLFYSQLHFIGARLESLHQPLQSCGAQHTVLFEIYVTVHS